MKKIHTLVRYLEICDGKHAGRVVPLRRECLGAAARAGKMRHPRRDQESEFVSFRSKGDSI